MRDFNKLCQVLSSHFQFLAAHLDALTYQLVCTI
ncbi:Uncharacterised protein [Klebsiella variicola]|nr:Uncharacterised protein [Klebsiella variicola]SXD77041.1 Uncharacterised protein [Klebsiella variicola]